MPCLVAFDKGLVFIFWRLDQVLWGYISRTCKDSMKTLGCIKLAKETCRKTDLAKGALNPRHQKRAWKFGWPYLVLTANHNTCKNLGALCSEWCPTIGFVDLTNTICAFHKKEPLKESQPEQRHWNHHKIKVCAGNSKSANVHYGSQILQPNPSIQKSDFTPNTSIQLDKMFYYLATKTKRK